MDRSESRAEFRDYLRKLAALVREKAKDFRPENGIVTSSETSTLNTVADAMDELAEEIDMRL